MSHAKHRKSTLTATRARRAARGSLVAAAGIATVTSAAPAGAATVEVPGTGFTAEIPDDTTGTASTAADAAGGMVRDVAAQYAPGFDVDAALSAMGAASFTEAAPAPVAAPMVSVGQKIADAAMSKQGSPYVYGATGPSSFDCSGLTSWAYHQVGKSIPRTSGAQASGGQQVPLGALQVGDIISFYGASHVGIYIGDNKVVHAPTEGDVVKITDMAYMPADSAVRF